MFSSFDFLSLALNYSEIPIVIFIFLHSSESAWEKQIWFENHAKLVFLISLERESVDKVTLFFTEGCFFHFWRWFFGCENSFKDEQG